MDEPRKRSPRMMSGLDIRYDLGEGHPLLGRRMPDLDLVTADGPRRVFTLLHDARPVLLNLGEPGALDIAPWADRVQRVDARYAGAWELPVLGAVAAPTAVLIRPDGYVAWVGRPDQRASRRPHHLVRTACCGVAHRLPRSTSGADRDLATATDRFIVPEPCPHLPRLHARSRWNPAAGHQVAEPDLLDPGQIRAWPSRSGIGTRLGSGGRRLPRHRRCIGHQQVPPVHIAEHVIALDPRAPLAATLLLTQHRPSAVLITT